MNKISFNKPAIQLDGTPVENVILSKELADGLAQQPDSKNPMKIWEWCQKLYKDGELELTTDDVELLKEAIKTAKGFRVMFSGQLLQEITNQTK